MINVFYLCNFILTDNDKFKKTSDELKYLRFHQNQFLTNEIQSSDSDTSEMDFIPHDFVAVLSLDEIEKIVNEANPIDLNFDTNKKNKPELERELWEEKLENFEKDMNRVLITLKLCFIVIDEIKIDHFVISSTPNILWNHFVSKKCFLSSISLFSEIVTKIFDEICLVKNIARALIEEQPELFDRYSIFLDYYPEIIEMIKLKNTEIINKAKIAISYHQEMKNS